MPKKVVVEIYDIAGTELCVATEDGDRVFEQVKKALDEDYNVAISFRNVESLTSTFLNHAIGRLYGVYDWDFIGSKLSVINTERGDLGLISRAVETAKTYFNNPDIVDEIVENDMGDDDD